MKRVFGNALYAFAMSESAPREWIVGAVQLESDDRLIENLARAEELARLAATRGASLILLPENFAFMGREEDKQAVAEDLSPAGQKEPGPISGMLSRVAKETKSFVIGGGLPERSSDPHRPFNTSAAFGPDGNLVAIYRKIHLFDVDVGDGTVYRESSSTSAGDRAIVFQGSGGLKVGMSVCYDVRFPELYRALADGGAQLATVPAAFTLMTGKDHWHVLLRARAIESQLFVVAAAQCGSHPRGRRTYGKSVVIDPWGDVIAQCSDGPGVITAHIESTRLDKVRASLPSLRHRRPFTQA